VLHELLQEGVQPAYALLSGQRHREEEQLGVQQLFKLLEVSPGSNTIKYISTSEKSLDLAKYLA